MIDSSSSISSSSSSSHVSSIAFSVNSCSGFKELYQPLFGSPSGHASVAATVAANENDDCLRPSSRRAEFWHDHFAELEAIVDQMSQAPFPRLLDGTIQDNAQNVFAV